MSNCLLSQAYNKRLAVVNEALQFTYLSYCSLFIVICNLFFKFCCISVLGTVRLNMVRPKDQIWEEWTDCGKDVDGKNQGECNYCGQRLQVNVTRFKQHTVLVCRDTP